MAMILAIDMGKNKSVCCHYDPQSGKERYKGPRKNNLYNFLDRSQVGSLIRACRMHN